MFKRVNNQTTNKKLNNKVNRRQEMKQKNPWIIAIMILAVLQFWGCSEHKDHHFEHPSQLEEIEGSEFTRVILTAKAIERIDLQTAEVTEVRFSPARLAVPYSSIIYGPEGQTWVYTSPEPRTFERYTVEVDYIKGDWAVLNVGPPLGTLVVSVAAAEVYGTEFNVGH